jgi:hypothetical protein
MPRLAGRRPPGPWRGTPSRARRCAHRAPRLDRDQQAACGLCARSDQGGADADDLDFEQVA